MSKTASTQKGTTRSSDSSVANDGASEKRSSLERDRESAEGLGSASPTDVCDDTGDSRQSGGSGACFGFSPFLHPTFASPTAAAASTTDPSRPAAVFSSGMFCHPSCVGDSTGAPVPRSQGVGKRQRSDRAGGTGDASVPSDRSVRHGRRSPSRNQPPTLPSSPHPRDRSFEDGDRLDGQLVVAREMSRLSIRERESINEDVHGIVPRTQREETPRFVNSQLAEMDRTLQQIQSPFRRAYDQARCIDPDYVQHSKYKLLMLRASNWNVVDACQRLFVHYRTKDALFGRHVLARDIVYDDLAADARQSLENGAFFLSPYCTDTAGRVIAVDMYSRWKYTSYRSQCQAYFWTVLRCAAQLPPDTHRKGLVGVSFMEQSKHSSNNLSQVFRAILSEHNLMASMPLKLTVTHLCFGDEAWFRPVFYIYSTVAPREMRIRVKTHFGSFLEILYILSSFGISFRRSKTPSKSMPTHSVPSVSGTVDNEDPDCLRGVLPVEESGQVRIDVIEQYIRDLKGTTHRSAATRAVSEDRKASMATCTFDNSLESIPSSRAAPAVSVISSNARADSVPPPPAAAADSVSAAAAATRVTGNGQTFENAEPTRQSLAGTLGCSDNNNNNNNSRSRLLSVTKPNPQDVLLGRGAPYRNFSGNRRMTALLEQHKAAHDLATARTEKTMITRMIVDQVKQYGGRFLKRAVSDGESVWVEAHDDIAREKVAMGFRNLTRRARQQLQHP